MTNSKVSVRYAKALFESAKEKQILDLIKVDVDLLTETVVASDQLQILLENPTVSSGLKLETLVKIFETKVAPLTVQFFQLIAKNKREADLLGILRHFQKLYKEENNILDALMITTTKLDDKQKEEMMALLKKTYQADIHLTEKIDTEIIGGFILRIDDKQVDASIVRKLQKIKNELLQTALN